MLAKTQMRASTVRAPRAFAPARVVSSRARPTAAVSVKAEISYVMVRIGWWIQRPA